MQCVLYCVCLYTCTPVYLQYILCFTTIRLITQTLEHLCLLRKQAVRRDAVTLALL